MTVAMHISSQSVPTVSHVRADGIRTAAPVCRHVNMQPSHSRPNSLVSQTLGAKAFSGMADENEPASRQLRRAFGPDQQSEEYVLHGCRDGNENSQTCFQEDYSCEEKIQKAGARTCASVAVVAGCISHGRSLSRVFTIYALCGIRNTDFDGHRYGRRDSSCSSAGVHYRWHHQTESNAPYVLSGFGRRSDVCGNAQPCLAGTGRFWSILFTNLLRSGAGRNGSVIAANTRRNLRNLIHAPRGRSNMPRADVSARGFCHLLAWPNKADRREYA